MTVAKPKGECTFCFKAATVWYRKRYTAAVGCVITEPTDTNAASKFRERKGPRQTVWSYPVCQTHEKGVA